MFDSDQDLSVLTKSLVMLYTVGILALFENNVKIPMDWGKGKEKCYRGESLQSTSTEPW